MVCRGSGRNCTISPLSRVLTRCPHPARRRWRPCRARRRTPPSPPTASKEPRRMPDPAAPDRPRGAQTRLRRRITPARGPDRRSRRGAPLVVRAARALFRDREARQSPRPRTPQRRSFRSAGSRATPSHSAHTTGWGAFAAARNATTIELASTNYPALRAGPGAADLRGRRLADLCGAGAITAGSHAAGEDLAGRPGADNDDVEIRHDYAALSSRLA